MNAEQHTEGNPNWDNYSDKQIVGDGLGDSNQRLQPVANMQDYNSL
jgi:hypothetical protein